LSRDSLQRCAIGALVQALVNAGGLRLELAPSHGVTGRFAMEIRHPKFNRITFDPSRCFGKPCIRGLRIPVSSILAYLASGMTIDEILEEWPELEGEDIYQALDYAAWATDERVIFEAPGVTEGRKGG